MTAHELCRRMGHPPSLLHKTCLCGAKRYRIVSMFHDLRDLCRLGQHLRKHGM
jgi:hypothetical protein